MLISPSLFKSRSFSIEVIQEGSWATDTDFKFKLIVRECFFPSLPMLSPCELVLGLVARGTAREETNSFEAIKFHFEVIFGIIGGAWCSLIHDFDMLDSFDLTKCDEGWRFLLELMLISVKLWFFSSPLPLVAKLIYSTQSFKLQLSLGVGGSLSCWLPAHLLAFRSLNQSPFQLLPYSGLSNDPAAPRLPYYILFSDTKVGNSTLWP